MRISTLTGSLLASAVLLLPLAGVASAADRDCPDFSSQAEAQAALNSRIGDPERLDRDDDGIACESEFGEPAASDDSEDESDEKSDEKSDEDDQVRVVPKGSVDTGDGSAATGSTSMLLALTGAGALTAGGALSVRYARGTR
jgi:hypothetical protein